MVPVRMVFRRHLAFLDPVSLQYVFYRNPIPILCDNSYQAKMYVPWLVMKSHARARWYCRNQRCTLTDFQLYISAL